MIPVAARLRDRNCRVFIGTGEKHAALFRAELKGLSFIDFRGFSPGYSKYFPQYFIMLLKSPLLLFHIIKEHRTLRKIVRDYDIDIVISDNRFGCWNNAVTSVYVTHILRIPLPAPWKIFEKAGVLLHRWIINRYDYCMIPDLPGIDNLSGMLSHNLKLPANVRYTGIMSRFENASGSAGRFDFPHNTVILSGPEPQRSILRQKLISALKHFKTVTVILEGRPDKKERPGNKEDVKIRSYSHLSVPDMSELLRTSGCIMSRSGYTTIMDLVFLNCTGLLIPTPGQTEQEYLADYLSGKGWFDSIKQKEIDENIILTSRPPVWPMSITGESKMLLDSFLIELLQKHQEKSS